MAFNSILFLGDIPPLELEEPDFFVDLNLDQVLASMPPAGSSTSSGRSSTRRCMTSRRALPARGLARPREARGARVDHAVRISHGTDAGARRPSREAPPPAPEAGMAVGRDRDLLRGRWLARGRPRRVQRRPRPDSGAARLPDGVHGVRALHLAGGRDASAEGGARRGAVRGSDPGARESRSAAYEGEPDYSAEVEADVRQVQAGSGEELPGQAARLRRNGPCGGADPRACRPASS